MRPAIDVGEAQVDVFERGPADRQGIEFDTCLDGPSGEPVHGGGRVLQVGFDQAAGQSHRAAEERAERRLDVGERKGFGQGEAHDRPAHPIDELIRRSLGDQLALRQHAHAISQMLGLVEIMGGQQHGRAVGTQRLDEVPRTSTSRRIESGRGLVEEQQLGATDDPQRQVDPTALATRQRSDALVDLLLQTDQGDDLVDRPWASITPSVQREHFTHGELDFDARGLQDDADPIAEVPPGSRRILPEHLRRPGRGRAVAFENLDRRRLAGAVLPEQCIDLTDLHLEAHTVERDDRPVQLAKIFDDDGRHDRANLSVAGRTRGSRIRRGDGQARVVAQVLGRRDEVRHQLLRHLVGKRVLATRRLHGSGHVHQPAITLQRSDVEGHVSHPQSRMATLFHVGLRSAPVLGQEQGQAMTGSGEIGRSGYSGNSTPSVCTPS